MSTSSNLTPQKLYQAYVDLPPEKQKRVYSILFPKQLRTSDELIAHMKLKGITFNFISQGDAKHFLEEHNYYFKLAAYRKNYDKVDTCPNKGKYINLDFSYLRDLSTIDFHLRYLILHMCLDIEHSLRTVLLENIAQNNNEDGYHIVEIWDPSQKHRNKLAAFLTTSYCKELIEKYAPNYPAWALFELLSFGELCNFAACYNKEYPKTLPFDVKLLFPIRDLRNAAAHNNCLIHDVRSNSGINVNATMAKTISTMFHRKNKRLKQRNLKNKPIHDFVCLLYFYPKIVQSEYLRDQRKKELISLFTRRMLRNKDFYMKNAALQGTYKFICKVFAKLKKEY